jgi:hypothetical protein
VPGLNTGTARRPFSRKRRGAKELQGYDYAMGAWAFFLIKKIDDRNSIKPLLNRWYESFLRKGRRL